MDNNKNKVSRKEILPAFLISLAGIIVLFIIMNSVNPKLSGNSSVPDFVAILTGAAGGEISSKAMWFLSDFTETTFLACPLASVFMIVFAFIASALEKKKSRFAGTGVSGSSAVFGKLFLSACISMILGLLVFGSFFEKGFIPTFASFLTVQAFILFYGADIKKIVTSIVIGTPITFLACHYILQYVITPLGLPLFLSVSAGIFVAVPVCSWIFRLLPWMTPAAPAAPGESGPFVPSRFFVNQIFGDIGSLALWGSSLATIGMYFGAIISWILNPLSPAYSLNIFPTFMAAQLLTAALAIFVFYPAWRKNGMAFTFASVVITSAILSTYPAHPVIIILTIVYAALVGAPCVDLSLKLFKFKGQIHPLPFIQFGILVAVVIWSYVIKLVLIPLCCA